MKKSLQFNLSIHFGLPGCMALGDAPHPMISIHHADVYHYRTESDYAIEQAFDARDCYLYSYDIAVQEKLTVPIRAVLADLHVLYLFLGNASVVLCNDTGETLTTLAPEHARYLYLPSGQYHLQFEPGIYCLFGFYFDGGLFRDGNERPFAFLEDVIQAYREKLSEPVASIDFPAGEHTLNQIRRFCRRIKKGDIENEKFVVQELIRLLKLSKEKVFDEYERTTDPELLIQRCRELLAEYIAEQGNIIRVGDIARQLHVSHEHLSRLHQQYYQQKLNDYREELVIQKISGLLQEPYTLHEVSHLAGFPAVKELNRFYKRKTGMTPAQFRNH